MFDFKKQLVGYSRVDAGKIDKAQRIEFSGNTGGCVVYVKVIGQTKYSLADKTKAGLRKRVEDEIKNISK